MTTYPRQGLEIRLGFEGLGLTRAVRESKSNLPLVSYRRSGRSPQAGALALVPALGAITSDPGTRQVTPNLLLLIITVLVALAFDFLNGFHDAANTIATVVSTRVLSPGLAVVWAAVLQFRRGLLFWRRRGQDHRDAAWSASGSVTSSVVFAGLIGAIVWDL